MPALEWNTPPADVNQPIVDGEILAIHQYLGSILGTMPDDLAGQAGKLVRVRSDETGLELTPGLPGIETPVRVITGDADLTAENADVAQAGDGTLELGQILVRHSTPSTAVTLTIPASAAVGRRWTIWQDLAQTGVVTIHPASGVTLQGGTGDVTLDGPGAVVALQVVRNTGGSAAEVLVAGASSLGQALSGVTELGEVKGAFATLGAAITGDVTLGAADRGTERRITATTTKTITVPSGFRGVITLWNASAANHTIALGGVGNRTLAAGNVGVVRGNGTELCLFEASPKTS